MFCLEGRKETGTRMNEQELLKNKILDADKTAYERNILKVCGFLSLDEQSVYHGLQKEFLTKEHFLSGGHEEAERVMAFFLPDYLDRESAVREKISAVSVVPANRRFAEELTHRDYLGALMNLGIERECIGDILADNERCVILVQSGIAGFVADSLTRIRHTNVECAVEEGGIPDIRPRFEELKVNIASERVDAVTAAVFRVSRQKASELVASERIFINGQTVVSAGRTLKEGDRVSVRGAGKYIYDGISGSSRKGRLFADIRRFV